MTLLTNIWGCSLAYVFQQPVLFKHCDPAGIVFYPRYFEMINDCVETFFDQVIGVPFHIMHPKNGVPLAQIDCKFRKPSRHGDHLTLELTVKSIGTSALGLAIVARSVDEIRFETCATIVYVNEAGRPTTWSEDIKSIFQLYQKAN